VHAGSCRVAKSLVDVNGTVNRKAMPSQSQKIYHRGGEEETPRAQRKEKPKSTVKSDCATLAGGVGGAEW
jgi:hypothetical protein